MLKVGRRCGEKGRRALQVVVGGRVRSLPEIGPLYEFGETEVNKATKPFVNVTTFFTLLSGQTERHRCRVSFFTWKPFSLNVSFAGVDGGRTYMMRQRTSNGSSSPLAFFLVFSFQEWGGVRSVGYARVSLSRVWFSPYSTAVLGVSSLLYLPAVAAGYRGVVRVYFVVPCGCFNKKTKALRAKLVRWVVMRCDR